jgi:hypothetical protein
MKVITARTQIRGLADRMKNAWQRSDGTWKRIQQKEPDTEKIHAAVSALDPETATVEDVASAIGFVGWITEMECNECLRIVDLVVELGEEPDYESRTARICVACLTKALIAVHEVVR